MKKFSKLKKIIISSFTLHLIITNGLSNCSFAGNEGINLDTAGVHDNLEKSYEFLDEVSEYTLDEIPKIKEYFKSILSIINNMHRIDVDNLNPQEKQSIKDQTIGLYERSCSLLFKYAKMLSDINKKIYNAWVNASHLAENYNNAGLSNKLDEYFDNGDITPVANGCIVRETLRSLNSDYNENWDNGYDAIDENLKDIPENEGEEGKEGAEGGETGAA